MNDNECCVCYNVFGATRYKIGCGNGHEICHDCEWTMREKAPVIDGIRDPEDTHRPLTCPMCRVVEKTAGERSFESMQNELRQIYLEYFLLKCRVAGDTRSIHAQQETRQLVPVPITPPRAPRARSFKGKCMYDGAGCTTKGKTSLMCGITSSAGIQCTGFLCRRCKSIYSACSICVN
jgi:hypothetical protein